MQKGITISLLLVLAVYLMAQTKPKSKAQSGIPKATMERGKQVYEAYCLACHQADGSGVPRLNPPITKTKWVLGDKKQLITIILKGMDEPIEVNGEEYTNTMGAHDFLKDQEVADLLTYVRNSFGNKATAVTTAEVKTMRAKVR